MSNIDVLIGQELKKARHQKKLSQQQVADEFGVSRQTVSFWENGNRSMNFDDFISLCNRFGFNAQEMINNVMSRLR